MRSLLMIVLSIAFVGCQSSEDAIVAEGEYSPNRSVLKFIKGFEKAVMTHESALIMEYLHEDYVKEQHDQFLNERTDQFLNELFCGDKLDEKGFACLEYKSIESIEFLKATNENGVKWIYFTVENEEVRVLMDLSITASTSKLKYGFVGAYG